MAVAVAAVAAVAVAVAVAAVLLTAGQALPDSLTRSREVGRGEDEPTLGLAHDSIALG